MLQLLRSSTSVTRHLLSRSFLPATLKRFSTTTSDKPHGQTLDIHQSEHLLDRILAEINQKEEEDVTFESPYQANKVYSESNVSLLTMGFDDLLDLLKFLGMFPKSLEKISLSEAQLLTALNAYIAKIQIDNVTTIVWALGKLRFEAPQIFSWAQDVILKGIHELETHEIAIIIWSFARANWQSEKFWSQITKVAHSKMLEMTLLDLQQIVWGLSKVHFSDDAIWRSLEDNIMKNFKAIKSEQAISLFLMSFAKMQKGSDSFWRSLETKFEKSAAGFGTQALTNALWSLARRNRLLNLKSNGLEALILSRLSDMNDIEVASIAYTFAKVYKGTPEFWKAVSQRMLNILETEELEMMTLSSWIWAMKNFQDDNQKLWKALESQVRSRAHEIDSNYLYSILASFAQKKKGSLEVWSALERQTLELSETFDGRNWANVIWCFATANKGSSLLWNTFSQNLAEQAKQMTDQGIVVSLWGFAKVYKRLLPEHYMQVLEVLQQRFEQLKDVDVGMLMWSLGKFKSDDPITESIVQRVIERIMEGKELPLIDFAQSVYAISELRVGNVEFWEKVESIFFEKEDFFHEEGLVLLTQAGAGSGAEFSDEFWERVENRVLNNLNKFTNDSLIGFMNGFFKRGAGSVDFWITMEEKLKNNLKDLNDNALAEVAWILARRRVSQNEFWEQLEYVVLERMNKLNLTTLAKFAQCFGMSQQGSLNLWAELQAKTKEKLIKESHTARNALKQILDGFSKRKKGDHQFWNVLEKKLLEELKTGKVNEHELFAFAQNLSRVKRGSREIWKKILELFIANVHRLNFDKMLRMIRQLDFVKEIDATEKQMLLNMCMERLLEANENFGGYLRSLASYEDISRHLKLEDLQKIDKKILHLSQKAADSSTIDQMRENLIKISSSIGS